MNQLEMIQQENKTLYKACIIAESKRVRKTSCHKIWIVGSGNPKTPKTFYSVMYDEDRGEIMCDCKAYEFGMTVPCCHILAAAIFVGSSEEAQGI